MCLREISRLSTHISLENHRGIKVKTIEFIDEADQVSLDDLISPWIFESLGDMPLIQADVNIISKKYKSKDEELPANLQVLDPKKLNGDNNALLVVGHQLLSNDRVGNLSLLLSEVKQGGFLLSREKIEDSENVEHLAQIKGLHVILEKKCGKEMFILLRKQEKLKDRVLVINVNNENFNWVDEMRETMSEELKKETGESTRVIFVGQGEFDNGICKFNKITTSILVKYISYLLFQVLLA